MPVAASSGHTAHGGGAEPPNAGALRDERGQILGIVALFALSLIAIGGFFIDVSILFLTHRNAQHLADSAVLSAAGARVSEPDLRETGTITFDSTVLAQRACAILQTHPQLSSCPSGNAVVTLLPGNDLQVTVTLTAPVTLLAFRGRTANSVTATATAGLTVDARASPQLPAY